MPDASLHTPSEDLELLRGVVREAGDICLAAFHRNNAKSWNKDNNSPVTETDLAVNDFLLDALMAARPDYGWLSEETADDDSRRNRARTFVVDPIDGTRAFIERKPGFAISVAVIEDGLPIAGVVFNPLKEEFFEAHSGGGARLNGEALSVSDCTQEGNCVMVGYPRKFQRMGFPEMRYKITNSMAYRIAMVASSDADATLSWTPKSDWDVAAAALIAAEAGAIITNLHGDAMRFDGETTTGMGVICASPPLHALLLERVRPILEDLASGRASIRDFQYLGTTMSDRDNAPIQLLHLVIGGELIDPNKTTFKNLSDVEFVGAYANYADAHDAWKSAAQRTVDNAHARFFILHAHELIDPDKDGVIG